MKMQPKKVAKLAKKKSGHYKKFWANLKEMVGNFKKKKRRHSPFTFNERNGTEGAPYL